MQGGLTLRRGLALAGLAVALLLAALWTSGALVGLRHWAEAGARGVQQDMAGAVRAIANGQAGALVGLLAVSFGYGFFHAAGPGHGKLLIGSYGMARRVPLLRLAGLAFVSSLAQATVAVVMVYAFVLALGWARTRLVDLSDAVFLPLSSLAVAGIGIWLVIRGLRGLRRATLDHHDHHDHDHGPDCGCGHAHGPTVAQVEQARGWRDTLALIGGVAVRPCSGALFLLILTFQMGIGAAGVAGAFAMGLGVAVVTVAVAVLAVWSREGVLAGLGEARVWRALPWVEIAGGVVIVAFAQGMIGGL